MKKLFIILMLVAPLVVGAHASDEPHEEPPAPVEQSQTPAALGGFLVGVAVGMIFTKILVAKKGEE